MTNKIGMANKEVRVPGVDHPITITAADERVVVSVAGHVVADTTAALSLQEAAYPAVYYIPMADVDQSVLAKTDHATYCPYKGDCSYYSIAVGSDRRDNAVWTYENPYPAVAAIAGHVAFYPNRVDDIAVQPA